MYKPGNRPANLVKTMTDEPVAGQTEIVIAQNDASQEA